MGKKGWFGAGFASGILAAVLIFNPGGLTTRNHNPDPIENLAAASPAVYELASRHYHQGNIEAPDPYVTVSYVAEKAVNQTKDIQDCLNDLENKSEKYDQINSIHGTLTELRERAKSVKKTTDQGHANQGQNIVDDAHTMYLKFLAVILVCL